jgi:hypothetical protein
VHRPRITSVLHQTSYLVAPIVKKSSLASVSPFSSPRDSPKTTSEYTPTDDQINNVAYAPITAAVKQRTSVRLLETLQFVLDIMGSPLASAQNIARVPSASDPEKTSVLVEDTVRVGPGCMKPLEGEGWRSTVRVRLLHGVVRKRIMSTVGKEREKGFDGTGRKVGYDFDQGESLFGLLIMIAKRLSVDSLVYLGRWISFECRRHASHVGFILCGSPLGMSTDRLPYPTSP